MEICCSSHRKLIQQHGTSQRVGHPLLVQRESCGRVREGTLSQTQAMNSRASWHQGNLLSIRRPLTFLAQIILLLLEPQENSYQSSPVLSRPFPKPTDERGCRAIWWKKHYLEKSNKLLSG